MAAIIRKHGTGNWFDDLSPAVRWRAQANYNRYCAEWQGNLPRWRKGILVGQARRYAKRPATREWGIWMHSRLLAKWGRKGGLRTQERYREEDRVGRFHTIIGARKVMIANRRFRKQKREEADRQRLGFPPRPRSGFTNMD